MLHNGPTTRCHCRSERVVYITWLDEHRMLRNPTPRSRRSLATRHGASLVEPSFDGLCVTSSALEEHPEACGLPIPRASSQRVVFCGCINRPMNRDCQGATGKCTRGQACGLTLRARAPHHPSQRSDKMPRASRCTVKSNRWDTDPPSLRHRRPSKLHESPIIGKSPADCHQVGFIAFLQVAKYLPKRGGELMVEQPSHLPSHTKE